MSEKLHIVLGNEFVTFKGVHYVAKSGCGDEEESSRPSEDASSDLGTCDPRTPLVPKVPSDIVYVNRQSSAINAGLASAELEVRNRLLLAFPGSREVRVICADQFALRDLIKNGSFHKQFNVRYTRSAGVSLNDSGSLISAIEIELKKILMNVRLHVQLDHSGNVKDYLEPDAYDRLTTEFAVPASHTGFKTSLITPPFLARGISLAETLPLVKAPFEVPLSDSCFTPANVSIVFERVIRDYLRGIAVRCEWDETVNVSPVTNMPFYVQEEGESPRNAINFEGVERKPVVACVGVVAGVPSLIAHQSDGGLVRMFMERDSVKRRVDQRIIEAGLCFYEQAVAVETVLPSEGNFPEMKMPKPLRSELFMAFTGTELVQDSGAGK